MSDLTDFADSATLNFRACIVDAFFLFLQNDPALLEEYKKLIQSGYPKKDIHSLLSKKLAENLGLTKSPIGHAHPKSSLITKYRRHE